jgi:D-alanyl-D-alanine carboxypeptidase
MDFYKTTAQTFLIAVIHFAISSFISTDKNCDALLKWYPQIKKIEDNKVYFHDNTYLIYDDKKEKTANEILNNPDIEDMFTYRYVDFDTKVKTDAGRIRNEAFFNKIYGESSQKVQKNLVTMDWCYNTTKQKIKVTTVNGIDKKLQLISKEIEKKDYLNKFVNKVGGTFLWRKIAGTNRQSMHSYGMTIDINTQYSNYWQWDCKCKDESQPITYKNKIPKELVAIFEKHGFIWGGNWKHYDTMHFEYRPELLFNK